MMRTAFLFVLSTLVVLAPVSCAEEQCSCPVAKECNDYDDIVEYMTGIFGAEGCTDNSNGYFECKYEARDRSSSWVFLESCQCSGVNIPQTFGASYASRGGSPSSLESTDLSEQCFSENGLLPFVFGDDNHIPTDFSPSSLSSYPNAVPSASPSVSRTHMWCPEGYCRRTVNPGDGMVGSVSLFNECYDPSTNSVLDEVWTGELSETVPPEGWIEDPVLCVVEEQCSCPVAKECNDYDEIVEYLTGIFGVERCTRSSSGSLQCNYQAPDESGSYAYLTSCQCSGVNIPQSFMASYASPGGLPSSIESTDLSEQCWEDNYLLCCIFAEDDNVPTEVPVEAPVKTLDETSIPEDTLDQTPVEAPVNTSDETSIETLDNTSEYDSDQSSSAKGVPKVALSIGIGMLVLLAVNQVFF